MDFDEALSNAIEDQDSPICPYCKGERQMMPYIYETLDGRRYTFYCTACGIHSPVRTSLEAARESAEFFSFGEETNEADGVAYTKKKLKRYWRLYEKQKPDTSGFYCVFAPGYTCVETDYYVAERDSWANAGADGPKYWTRLPDLPDNDNTYLYGK